MIKTDDIEKVLDYVCENEEHHYEEFCEECPEESENHIFSVAVRAQDEIRKLKLELGIYRMKDKLESEFLGKPFTQETKDAMERRLKEWVLLFNLPLPHATKLSVVQGLQYKDRYTIILEKV